MITGVSSLCSKASEAESTFRPREGDVVIHFNEKEVGTEAVRAVEDALGGGGLHPVKYKAEM